MSDRPPIRDRTLILRILVPGLETRLRDKMKEMEDSVTENSAAGKHGEMIGNSNTSNSAKESILDLEGVTCEPTQEGSTLWNFHCDGATYPARLVNLPCPIEIHKTHDHAMYYKSSDIAQMLIVYEDSMALDEADAYPKTDGFPSYYHSGLTPPLKRVVERRFALREQTAVPPPRAEVNDVEHEIHDLMCKISKETGKRNKVPSLAAAQHANKVLEEVIEEVIDYEPWMDDYGKQPSGIELNATDTIASVHPEIWLTPDQIDEIKGTEREKEEKEKEEERKKILADTLKKEKKKKKKEKAAAAAAAAAANRATPTKKKGIASNIQTQPTDEVTQAAIELSGTDFDLMDPNLIDDEALDLGFDFDDAPDVELDFS